MPNNNDLIKSVKCVFSEAITQNKQYIIPPYQRGYKWNRENVFKLLDDLKSFELGNVAGSESFYCIQNITIVSLQDGTGWNVVDGQQRLTTLYILLSYLKKFVKEDTVEVVYSTLPKLMVLLSNFAIDQVFMLAFLIFYYYTLKWTK